MDRSEVQKSFTALKPLCDLLMKDPSIKCSLEVIDCIKTISDGGIQDLLDYILFPVIVHLQNDNVSKHTKEYLIKIIRTVLSKGRITNFKSFNKLYIIILSQIYDKNEPEKGMLIAIETIMDLCYVGDSSNESDIVLVDQVANTIMLLLPGIVSGLQEIAMGSDIQGHKITMMAIRAWARIICIVMQDKLDEESIPSVINIKKEETNIIDPLENKLYPEEDVGIKKHIDSIKRNQEWLNAAAIKLSILVQAMSPLRKHSHFKNIDMKPLIELLEENLYKLLTQLPRIVRSSDDSGQLVGLNQLCGYLRLLGKERLPVIIQSTAHVRRLLQALLYIIEIDCNGISLLEDIGVKDFDNLTHHNHTHSWKQMKFIQDVSCKDKIAIICELLGTYSDLRILVDNIFQAVHNVPQHRKELIYLLNSIVNVPITCNNTSMLSLYKEIIEFYIIEDFWYLPIEVTEDVPLRVAQNNVVQCCLLTEGLGLIAKNLGNNFERFLLKVLYLIIERAGSTNSLLSRVGIETLENIAKSLKHETIGDLLRANVDYFSYHVTIKLRRIERNPGVLDVVKVVMKYSSMDVLPCLREIVLDVLLQLNKINIRAR
ncbi:hypothetical protein M0802_016269 [Mischocyttarus mexicanus]|nr:hypothetical protein M0802_016269 [Mischocyttarus mexicanus]